MYESKPRFFLLAGINGAGKSTFYKQRLSMLGLPFVNADVIANEIDPTHSTHSVEVTMKAQSLASEKRFGFLKSGKSFVSETVFSHPSKIELLHEARRAGFLTTLMFIHVPNPMVALERIKTRVSEGGHDVPKDKVFARYVRIQENIKNAKAIPDDLYVYDNVSLLSPHLFVMHLRRGVVQRLGGHEPYWVKNIFPDELTLGKAQMLLEPFRREINALLERGMSFEKAVEAVSPMVDLKRIDVRLRNRLQTQFLQSKKFISNDDF